MTHFLHKQFLHRRNPITTRTLWSMQSSVDLLAKMLRLEGKNDSIVSPTARQADYGEARSASIAN
jgi:hypothetical protein